MKKSFLLSVLAILSAFASSQGQTTPEEVMADLNRTGGVYYAYPVVDVQNTPPPAGYSPVYISHYGRHGSRYLISDNDYKWVTRIMHRADSANLLTTQGKSLLARLDSIADEADGRGGDLSPLGVRQHRGIAERMYQSFPVVFEGADRNISARSTLVVRCVLSMSAFCERLKELNPSLNITRESSQRYMPYLCYHSPDHGEYTVNGPKWKAMYEDFKKRHTNPERMMSALFTDPTRAAGMVNPDDLMWGLYWIASDMQNMESDLSFHKFFTPQELFDLWQVFNLHFYVNDASFGGNGTKVIDNALPLIANIVETADEALLTGSEAATLRFGHDGNLIPLVAAMHIRGCDEVTADPDSVYRHFAEWKISPMAGNLQLIFFRNDAEPEDVLVKIMLNEEERELPIPTEHWPFYRWEDVKRFWNH